MADEAYTEALTAEEVSYSNESSIITEEYVFESEAEGAYSSVDDNVFEQTMSEILSDYGSTDIYGEDDPDAQNGSIDNLTASCDNENDSSWDTSDITVVLTENTTVNILSENEGNDESDGIIEATKSSCEENTEVENEADIQSVEETIVYKSAEDIIESGPADIEPADIEPADIEPADIEPTDIEPDSISSDCGNEADSSDNRIECKEKVSNKDDMKSADTTDGTTDAESSETAEGVIPEPILTVEKILESDPPLLSSANSKTDDIVGASLWKTYYNAATEFGAKGNDSQADETNLRNALLEAGKAGNALQQMIEVFVPAGTYHLKDSLFIFSNIWLHLADGAVMYRDDPSKLMLLGVYLDRDGNIIHSENCTVGGYNQIKNVKISGGEWNGGVKASDVYAKKHSEMEIVFRHGENITIENTTIGNDTATHSVNFDGCRNVTIDNVKFVNQYKYQGPDLSYYGGYSKTSNEAYTYKEALHTDYLYAGDKSSNAKPLQNLGMSNIIIKNCTFKNVVSGLGTHHVYSGIYADSYKVINCTFCDIPYTCINARNFRDFVCKENTAVNVNCFLNGENFYSNKNTTAYIIDNKIIGKKFSGVTASPAIDIRNNGFVLVMNNTFGNVQQDGVRLSTGQTSRTASYKLNAEVMQNLFYDGIGNGGGSADYAALRALPGVKLVTWKNNMYLNGASSSSKIYGIYLYGASDGCKLSTDYISGATYGIYATTLHNMIIKLSEVLKSKHTGIYAANINGLSIEGTKILCGLGNGLHVVKSSNVTNSKSLSLWNSGSDLLLYDLYNEKNIATFRTFMANNCKSSGVRLPCIGYLAGDVDFDGKLTKNDLDLLRGLLGKGEPLSPAETYMADLNKDNTVNHTDVKLLRSKLGL